MIKLSAYEKETTINFNNAEKTATVYTFDRKFIERLREAAEKYPDLASIDKDEEELGCITATIPKKWVKIMLPREYSEEDKEKLKKRLAKMREKRGKNKTEI